MTRPRGTRATPRSEHAIRPSDGGWAYWRTFQVRSTGFPASPLQTLANLDCLERAVALAGAETEVSRQSRAIADRVGREIGSLLARRRKLSKDSAQREASDVELRSLRVMEKALARRGVPGKSPAGLSQQLDGLKKAHAHAAALRRRFEARYELARARTVDALRAIAADRRFQEAVTWQSKQLLPLLKSFAAGDPVPQPRRVEELVASYAQRYCAKNDTIGFFGAVGWGAWVERREQGRVVTADLGDLETRNVFFEEWAVEALANRFAADRRLLPWLIPTRAAHIRLEAGRVCTPGGGEAPLSADQARLVEASDGRSTAREVASIVMRHPRCTLPSEADALEQFADLARAEWIHLGFGVPLGDFTPFKLLYGLLSRVDDDELRREYLQLLDGLEEARGHVEACAGDAEALARALEALDRRFEQITRTSASRNPGQTYGARTIAFEDCRSAGSTELSPEVLEELQRPLDLVLASARWFCSEIARIYRGEVDALFERLASAPGAQRAGVDLSTLWLECLPLVWTEHPPAIERAQADLVERWAKLLNIGANDRECSVSAADITTDALAAFACSGRAWQGARHHSPDVMIAAESLQAFQDDNYAFVLGELHVALNTIVANYALAQHPDPQSLLDDLHRDLGAPRLFVRSDRRQPVRTRASIDIRHDLELRCTSDATAVDARRGLAIGDFVVRRKGDELIAYSRDGRHSITVLDILGYPLSRLATERFRLAPEGEDSPRIKIDRLVVQRRSIRRSIGDFRTLVQGSEEEQFASIVSYAHRAGLPRHVFVKLRWERKPFYLDFASPVYVRLFARQVRNALDKVALRDSIVCFSEMLPEHEQLWMPWKDGERRTSEFRLVVSDAGDAEPSSTVR